MLTAADSTTIAVTPRHAPPDSSLPFVPSHVYLQPDDNFEATVDALDALLDRWFEHSSGRVWQQVYDQDTRFDAPEDALPSFPIISHTRSRASKETHRYIVLPDGRRVRRQYGLDPHQYSIDTLCGIRETMTIQDARSAFRQKRGSRQCRQCYGYHLPEPQPTVTSHSNSPVHSFGCQKCGHPVASGTYLDTDTTPVCRLCGYRTWRTIPATVSTDDHPLLDSALDPWMQQLSAISAELEDTSDQQDTTETTTSSGDAHTLLFDNALSLVEIPDAQGDMHTVETLREHCLALADSLHAPGVTLFTSGSPLRQALLNQTLYEATFDQENMVRWIAAGRFWQDGRHRLTITESHTLAAWLETIPHADLEWFAGDPESASPMLAHVQTPWVEPTTIMMRPLHHLLTGLLGAACLNETTLGHLSQRFRLSPFLIRRMATQLKDPTHTRAA